MLGEGECGSLCACVRLNVFDGSSCDELHVQTCVDEHDIYTRYGFQVDNSYYLLNLLRSDLV